jgi:hypothetical protein
MKRLAPVLATLLLASACGGSHAASPTPQQTLQQNPQPTASACPKGAKAQFTWPKEVPKDLPQPPTATLSGVTHTQDGLTIVRFTTQTSLQDSVLFIVREVQKAGFTLGRGDAEPAEADAPFGRGDLRGVYKVLSRTQCVSDWLVAVTHTHASGTSPLLPTPSHGPSSQPLPFG